MVGESVDVEAAEAAASGLVRRRAGSARRGTASGAGSRAAPAPCPGVPTGAVSPDEHLARRRPPPRAGPAAPRPTSAGRSAAHPRSASGRSGGWARSRSRTTPPAAGPRSRPSIASPTAAAKRANSRGSGSGCRSRSRAARRPPSPSAARPGPRSSEHAEAHVAARAARGRRRARSPGSRRVGGVERGPARRAGAGATSLHFTPTRSVSAPSARSSSQRLLARSLARADQRVWSSNTDHGARRGSRAAAAGAAAAAQQRRPASTTRRCSAAPRAYGRTAGFAVRLVPSSLPLES